MYLNFILRGAKIYARIKSKNFDFAVATKETLQHPTSWDKSKQRVKSLKQEPYYVNINSNIINYFKLLNKRFCVNIIACNRHNPFLTHRMN